MLGGVRDLAIPLSLVQELQAQDAYATKLVWCLLPTITIGEMGSGGN